MDTIIDISSTPTTLNGVTSNTTISVPASGPLGGTAYQVLGKASDINHDYVWLTISGSGDPAQSTARALIVPVRNQSGSAMTAGTVVYISGATGNNPLISRAQATIDATSAQTIGLVQSDIANNGSGFVVIRGAVSGLNTQALTEGQQLYLSPTVAGGYTTTKQYAPNHLVYVGIVTRSHPTLGSIEVAIQNGYEMDEIHDVSAQNPTNGDLLRYNSTTGLWENSTLATSGIQPLDSDLTAIAALTTTTFGRSLLTQADAAAARSVLGVGTGGATNLTTTAAPTTVTINSDTGTDAVIAAADGTNAGLLLPAEKTKITNTSGTNTGDQTISITGDVTAAGSTGELTATVTKINGTSLGGLATGILKNTTTTGVPSIATAGVDYATPSQLLGMKNRIINGGMDISQRGTSFVSPGDSTYTLDRFRSYVGTVTGACTWTQNSDAPPSNEYQNSLRIAVTTAQASIGTNGHYGILHWIEGYNIRDLIGRSFTLSFWVRSSKTGVHCVNFRSSGIDRTYIAEYNIIAENTWEYKTVTVVGGLITAGTWSYTNLAGLLVGWQLTVGSGLFGTAGSWQTGDKAGTSNQVNCLDTIGNVFAITGVQLEAGSAATPFEHRPYGMELALCQRYCRTAGNGLFGQANGTAVIEASESLTPPMRAAPTATIVAGKVARFRQMNVDFSAASPGLQNFVSTPFGFFNQTTGFTGLTTTAVAFSRNLVNDSDFILLSAEL